MTTDVLKSRPMIRLFGPAAILFFSANIANVANLLFNMIFARVMGPAAFADLTLLLTLKLGALSLLTAFQFAFSEFSTERKNKLNMQVRATRMSVKSLWVTIPIATTIIIFADYIAGQLNFSNPGAFAILALSIPFFIPLILYRGLAQGQIDLKKIVGSYQSEWIVRLFGCYLLWELGFGIGGISLVLVASILAGLIFSVDRSDINFSKHSLTGSQSSANLIGLAALPYLALQLSQIFVFDSDIVIAKIAFDQETAGLAAGLLLVQRIFFFAFLSFALLLQPIVRSKTLSRSGDTGLKDLFVLLFAIVVISALSISAISFAPELFATFLLGKDFTDTAPILIPAALVGVLFTVTHLCTVYMIASGRRNTVWIVLVTAIMQLIVLSSLSSGQTQFSLTEYFGVKLALQIGCLAIVIFSIFITTLKHRHFRQ